MCFIWSPGVHNAERKEYSFLSALCTPDGHCSLCLESHKIKTITLRKLITKTFGL